MKCTKKLMLAAMLAGLSVTSGYGMQDVEEEAQHKAQRDGAGMTPLHFAVIDGSINTVRGLLRDDANVNEADKRGCTPLHYAAARGRSDVVGLLIDAHAIVNKADKENMTPLHYAALNGRANVVKMLLFAHANPNLKNNNGKTPLACAQQSKDGETIALFSQKIEQPKGSLILNSESEETTSLLHSAGATRHEATKTSWIKRWWLNQ